MRTFQRLAATCSAALLLASIWLPDAVAEEATQRVPKSNVEELGVIKTVSEAATKAAKDPCVAGAQTFCFQDNRFAVNVTWRDFSGSTGVGTGVEEPVSDNSGVFWFFNEGNWEMLVKVLDGCDINGFFWVFSAATTDVEYTLTITDTETDTVTSYTNPLGNAAAALTDTEALNTCTQP